MTIVVYGDAPVDPMSTERSMHAIRAFMLDVAEAVNKRGENVIPIGIGGDHSLK